MTTEPKRLEKWQKFPLGDSRIAINLRAMLGLQDDEEIPETVWIVMGIHRALERQFIGNPWSPRDLASMIVESQALLPTMRNATKYVRGSDVFIENVGREGKYWNPGPLGLHLINCDGDVYLVKTESLKASQAAITNSQLNKDAKEGSLMRQLADELNPQKPEDPDVDVGAMADALEKGELLAARK